MPNVIVIAVDLYHGGEATNLDEASTIMKHIRSERASNILKGTLAYAGKKAEIQTIGWCFGGGW